MKTQTLIESLRGIVKKTNNMSTQEKTHANMHNIVMEKDKLLGILRNNKDKHDAIYALACSGYWEQSKTELEVKRAEIDKAIEEFKSDSQRESEKIFEKIGKKERFGDAIYLTSQLKVNAAVSLPYPENRTDDYGRAIKMIELSVYDTVELSEQEFDAYVLNNWAWKKKFVDTNDRYVKTLSNKYGRGAVLQAVTQAYGIQGAEGPEGKASMESFVDSVMISGAAY